MTDALAPTDRTYGGWRRPSSPGLGPLGLIGTGVLFAGLIVAIIAVAVGGLLFAIPVLFLTALVIVPLLVRDGNGRNGAQFVTARTAWGQGRLAGAHLYRSGPLARIPHGKCPLPGLAANLDALDARDSYGREFALLHHPNVGHVSVVLTTSPDGASLVDPAQVDTWVAHWAAWLAGLSHEPSLVAASVTIEASPDSGIRLRREVHNQMAADAPQLAREVLNGIVGTYPAGSATITSRVALTWSTAPRPGQKRRALGDMAVDIGQRLPGLTIGLGATGAGPARPMTTAELAAAVRVAYDPMTHALVDELGAADAGVGWADCGPVAAEEHWDHYRHDSGLSVSWQMSEPPRGLVYSNVLGNLLAPHADIARKRVTLLYRPHSPASATKVVERDRRDALFAANGRKVGRARDVVEVRTAEQAAAEEATGAGVVRFAMVITATVTDPAQLESAAVAVDNLATTSRIRLRRAYGSQASAFVAGLPLGMVLADHLRVPAVVREAM